MRDADGEFVKWELIGDGSFNTTYKSKEPFRYLVNGQSFHQTWIMKIPKKDKDAFNNTLNDAERAVKLWNEINPKYPAAFLPHNQGWIAPFLGGATPTDKMIAKKMIQIYKKTRRIIADGCGDGNMKLFLDQVFCVDVDQALRRDSAVSQAFYKKVVTFNKKKSGLDSYWKQYEVEYEEEEEDTLPLRPLSVAVIRTLMYLETQLGADKILDKYITDKTISRLHIFREDKKPILEIDLLMAANADDTTFYDYIDSPKPPRIDSRLKSQLPDKTHPLHHPVAKHGFFKDVTKTNLKETSESAAAWPFSLFGLW
jgi:hypothetical protein